MKLNLSQTKTFMNLFIDEKTTNYARLLNRIFELRYRFENIEKQEWYFRKGIESQKDQMEKMKKEYIGLVSYINTNSIEKLKGILTNAKERYDLFNAKPRHGFMNAIARGSLISKVNNANAMLKLKEKQPILPTWDEIEESYDYWKSQYKERKFSLAIEELFQEKIDPEFLLEVIQKEIIKEYSVIERITEFKNHQSEYQQKIDLLSESNKKLLNNIDMILFYVWDLARISKNTDLRDEYIKYSFELLEVLTSEHNDIQSISNCLVHIEEYVTNRCLLDDYTRENFAEFLLNLS